MVHAYLAAQLASKAPVRGASSGFGHVIADIFEGIGVIGSLITVLAFLTGFTWQPTFKRWIASLNLNPPIRSPPVMPASAWV